MDFFFQKSVSDSSLLVYKHAFDFWILTCYSTVLPNSLIRSSSFLVESIGFSMYTFTSSANSDVFTSSFPICMPLVFSSCLTAVAKISNTMLKRRGESGHLCLLPDLSGNDFGFCLLSMMLAIAFSYMAFIMLRYAPSTLTVLSVFIINGAVPYQMLFHLLICSCDFYLSFCLCDVLCVLICQYWTILPCLGWIPGDDGVWSFIYLFFFTGCSLPIFCWGFLHLYSSALLAFSFLFCCVFMWFED